MCTITIADLHQSSPSVFKRIRVTIGEKIERARSKDMDTDAKEEFKNIFI